MCNDLTVIEEPRETGLMMPAYSIEDVTHRYQAMVEFVKRVMREGVDYGTIPGTDKPTLYKAGAEKLTTFFGLSVFFSLEDKLENWDDGRFYYRYKCILQRSGSVVAEGEGSANSMEKKYRWRYLTENKATADEKARAVRVETRKSKYNSGTYNTYVVENDDPYTLVNTLQKMAQKRAMVQAALIAVNASEYFTQDLDDLGYDECVGNGQRMHAERQSAQTQASRASKHTTTARRAGNGKVARPMTAKQIKTAIEMKTQGDNRAPASEGQINYVARTFTDAAGGDKGKYHTALNYLFGVESSNKLTKRQASVCLKWLLDEENKDENGYATLHAAATDEVARVYRAAMESAGQSDMFNEQESEPQPEPTQDLHWSAEQLAAFIGKSDMLPIEAQRILDASRALSSDDGADVVARWRQWYDDAQGVGHDEAQSIAHADGMLKEKTAQ
jgi:hypothetical protein